MGGRIMATTINADTTNGLVITPDTSGELEFQSDGTQILKVDTSTGALTIPAGTTAQRPASPATGMIRYNTSITKCEAYQNGSWVAFHEDPIIYTGQYLVVAGGGAGSGPWEGGGGGAGGYIENTETTFTIGAVYTVTVGAGGVGVTNDIGTIGSNSVLSGTGISETAIGGGYGVSASGAKPPASGGSGGGSNRNVAGGAGTAGQGNAGGTNSGGATGGGGGAGAVGGNGTADTAGGNGGIGKLSSITGSSTYYAGGGGGASYSGTHGTGGSGGGANGVGSGTAPSGTANTGGGGGGVRSQTGKGGNGGSGVVILRVPTAKYSGTTTGSPTVTTDGSDTVIKFTGSGSYTA